MPKLNCPPADLRLIRGILKQWAPEAEIWAYGSRVNGQCHEASDLDLVIRNPQSLQQPTAHLAQIKQAINDSALPILVDLINWAYLPEPFKKEIQKCYVIL